MLYKVVLTFKSVDETLKCEQHFPVVLLIMLSKGALTFESVDGTLKCAAEQYSSCCTVSYTIQGCSDFCDHRSLLEHYFPVVLFFMLTKQVVLTFEPGDPDEILKSDHSNENY